MKKRVYLIFTIVLVLILSVGMLTACGNDKVKADDITSLKDAKLSNVGESIYNELSYISEHYKDRSSGTNSEKLFAEYVAQKLLSYGYVGEIKDNAIGDEFIYNNIIDGKGSLTSTNVIYKKDNPKTDKAVIITSQLDNLYSYEGYASEGVYEGATGVAIMLEIAKNIKDSVLPYDVYFVGFGGNAVSLQGAERFFNKFFVHHNKKDVLLAIDLSRPVGGDHMYMYSDEMDTLHNEFLYDIAMENNLDFRKVPSDKQPMQAMLLKEQPMPYLHAGLMSPTIFFVTLRVPTVNFFSANWEERTVSDIRERKGFANIANTERDNFDNFNKLVGRDRIIGESDMVYTVITKTLLDGGFVDVMESSIAKMPNYKIWSEQGLIMGLRIGIAVVLIVVAVFVGKHLRKDLPSLSMEQFMSDVGMHNNNSFGGGNPFGGNANNNVDPFGNDNNSNANNNNDPFADINREFGDNKKDDKKDPSDDIFGI